MKKYIYILMIFVSLAGCDNMLDTSDRLNKNDINFPASEDDLQSSLIAVYQPMAQANEFGTFHAGIFASDEVFAGGGTADYQAIAVDKHMKSNENMQSSIWANYYTGIYRANKLLENMEKVKNISDEVKKQITGEVFYMRAWYYFSLAQMFGTVPLFTVAEKVVKPKASASELYGQIAVDLKSAIELFPSTSFPSISKSKLGHANKWAAEALLARVFLFYTGYYEANDLPLAGGGTLSKSQIVSYLDDCINNSGHELATDFRNLWPYTNPLTVEDYPYTAGKGLKWLGEEGNNKETVFAIKFGNQGNWGNSFRNGVNTGFSLRGQPNNNADLFPFGSGWGMGTVNTRLVDQWKIDEPGDPRIQMSLYYINDPSEGLVKYTEAGWDQQDDTHCFVKKYTTIMVWKDKAAKKVYLSYTAPLFGAGEDTWIRESQDIVLIRFSDILLMHSELTQTNTGLNRVRARVGLPAIAYSFDALQKERLHELIFEGVRYYDLLRWYRKGAGAILQANQDGVDILNSNVKAKTKFNIAERINATGGFLPIPGSEILLSKGVLVQNPGWQGGEGAL